MMSAMHLEKRRKEVLDEMERIRSMCRGTVAEQFLKVPHKGKKDPVLRGPYYVFVRKEQGQNRSVRLTTPEQVEQARGDVERYRRFKQLCREFEELTEQLGVLERKATASEEALKKGLKSRSNKAGK